MTEKGPEPPKGSNHARALGGQLEPDNRLIEKPDTDEAVIVSFDVPGDLARRTR